MGMSINDAITRATWNAAKAIKHEELGNLVKVCGGYCGLEFTQWKFWITDAGGNASRY